MDSNDGPQPTGTELPLWAKPNGQAATPSVAEFRRWYEVDDNMWWRTACGHHQNLFEEACEIIDSTRAELNSIKAEMNDSLRDMNTRWKLFHRAARVTWETEEAKLRQELAATTKAKQENDERFQLERDQARIDADELRQQLSEMKAANDVQT